MVGGSGDADAESEVDFPLRRQIQIDGWKDLMLLESRGEEVRGRAYRPVVFDAAGDFLCEVVANFDVGRKDETLADRLTVQGAVERGVEIEIPASELLIDDGADFPSPGIGGELAALVANFVGEAKADWPFPLFGNGDAGTDVIANPLNAEAIALGSEDVEADFEPVGETVGDLDGFVFGVVGGVETVLNGFGAVDGEIAMELDHGVARIDEVVAVDLNFVVILGLNWPRRSKKQTTDQDDA